MMMIMILEALFTVNICLADIVCLYLEPLKNYKASKLTMLKNTQKCNILGLMERPWGLRPVIIHF